MSCDKFAKAGRGRPGLDLKCLDCGVAWGVHYPRGPVSDSVTVEADDDVINAESTEESVKLCHICDMPRCDCLRRMFCKCAGDRFGHKFCGILPCGCPKFTGCLGDSYKGHRSLERVERVQQLVGALGPETNDDW